MAKNAVTELGLMKEEYGVRRTLALRAGYRKDCRDRMTRRPACSSNGGGIGSGGDGSGREDCEGGCARPEQGLEQ